MANVTEMPPLEAPGTEESTTGSAPPATSTSQSAKKKTGRPRKGEEPDPETRARQFFDRAAQIPREDWGNRAWMYLYIDEPVCDEKQWGKMKYAKKLHQPIFDLEKVKDWYGSCKGWISLNLRKPDAQNTDQIGRHEFEIFDIHCPPKIPKACWTDDPVNKKWAALLPPEVPVKNDSTTTLRDAMGVIKDLKTELKEEMPASEPVNSTRETLETMKIAKDLFATPATAATPAKDPLEIATALATTFMQMKADNPMVDFLNKQMDRQHQEMMEMRKELAEARKEPAEKPKSLIDQLVEFASDDTKLDRIKKVASVFGLGGGDSGGGRTRFTGLDLAREFFTSPMGREVGNGLGHLLTSLAQSNAANGAAPTGPQALHPVPPNGAGVQPGGPTHETDEQKIMRIAGVITKPMIDEFFDQEEPGDLYAERIAELWPKDFAFLQTLGAETIVNLYQQYNPELWRHITVDNGNREPQFRKFIADFCAYNPDGDEPEAPSPVNTETQDGFEEGTQS
jgi:hypothetical protein